MEPRILIGWVGEVTGVVRKAGRLAAEFEDLAGDTVGVRSRAGEATRGAERVGAKAGGVIGDLRGGKDGKAVELSVLVGKAGEVAGGGGRVGGESGGAGEEVSRGAGLAGCGAWGVGRAKPMGEVGRGARGACGEQVEAVQVSLDVSSSVLEEGGAGLVVEVGPKAAKVCERAGE